MPGGPGRANPVPGIAMVETGLPRAAADLLRRLPILPAARRDLCRRLTGPDRRYHGLAHVTLLWLRHRRLGRGTVFRSPRCDRLLACAIAYHDAIYQAGRPDNEVASAQLWRHHARIARRLPRADIDWVAETILATADHWAQDGDHTLLGRARLWMLDLDLTPLGEPAARFVRNTALLRQEYGHLSDAAWNEGRRAFLRGIAGHARLFRTPVTAMARFEARARANLDAALAEIER